MPLYFGNSGKYVISFNGSQARAIMITRPEPDIPTGIYDDEWPISWNSLAVQGNYAVVDDCIKISNLAPTAEELGTATITMSDSNNVLAFELDSTEMESEEGITFIIYGFKANVGGTTGNGSDVYVSFYSVSALTEIVTEVGFTETGLYAVGMKRLGTGTNGAGIDFTLTLAQSVGNTITWDGESNIWKTLSNAYYTIDYAKVSNEAPIPIDLLNGEVTIVIEGSGTSDNELLPNGTHTAKICAVTDGDWNSPTEDIIAVDGFDIENLPTDEFWAAAVWSVAGAWTLTVYKGNEIAAALGAKGNDEVEDGIHFTKMTIPSTGTTIRISALTWGGESEPDTPTQYLYGQVVPSTVSYNGVVLPDIESVWTDKETYPYAYIVDQTTLTGASTYAGYYRLALTKYPAGNVNLSGVTETTGKGYKYFRCKSGDSNWEATVSNNYIGSVAELPNYPCVWCSADILNSDGTTYLSASDPVKSYPDADVIVDGVGYKGAVLPDIDEVWDKETYRYAAIAKFPIWDEFNYALLLSSAYGKYNSDDGFAYFNEDGIQKVYWLSEDKTTWQHDDSFPENVNAGDNVSQGFEFEYTWTNEDVTFVNGGIAFASTTPIPITSDLIGYSYGGVVLPELPEWDKEQYPHAVVMDMSAVEMGYCFMACRDMVVDFKGRLISSSDGTDSRDTATYSYVGGLLSADCTKWELVRYSGIGCVAVIEPVWTNTDILNTDGSTYMTASNPIPVYE